MSKQSSVHFKIKEGASINYIKALETKLGGIRHDHGIKVNQGNSKISISYYNLIPEFEMIITQVDYHQELIVERESDERADYFHFNLVNQGAVKQHIDNEEKYSEAGAINGVFIYNGLFPLKSFFPAKSGIQSMAFKFSKKGFAKLMPQSVNLLDNLFPNDEPLAYHTAINREMEKVLKELFYYESGEYAQIPMVMSRGLELFPLLMKSLKHQLDKDELNGLHIDDYNRLIEIKKMLLSDFDQKISIQAIADKYAISASKLKRDFKSLFDITIYKFFTNAKMDEAYRRLQTGQYSVTEVAFDLGYSSLSKFSEMFKKVKGINPKEVIAINH